MANDLDFRANICADAFKKRNSDGTFTELGENSIVFIDSMNDGKSIVMSEDKTYIYDGEIINYIYSDITEHPYLYSIGTKKVWSVTEDDNDDDTYTETILGELVERDIPVDVRVALGMHSVWGRSSMEAMSYGVALGVGFNNINSGPDIDAYIPPLAKGKNSVAEGLDTIAWGDDSHVEGCGNRTNYLGEHAEGTYNYYSYDKSISTIGIGDSDTLRKNARVVTRDGLMYLLNVGGFLGKEIDTTTMKDAATVINAKADTPTVDESNTSETPTVTVGDSNKVYELGTITKLTISIPRDDDGYPAKYNTETTIFFTCTAGITVSIDKPYKLIGYLDTSTAGDYVITIFRGRISCTEIDTVTA